ncbi:beta-ketoacyl synthase N-terminal-like domain-containing protein [Halomonas sp. SpR8]|uniref:beta-ketoacyl synthase n=1 Tax=Halomonas sp. SpR8 TaxID=3050463 RepID=UPI0027E55AA6|nr:beta-ketoacyl synthase N-terminal-like domain-containing protein [Halomonas sp. SpR8]MDQ7730836.1 beta-ketoacyl synthase N-terminal-like domain-containing protein [Halomonas sp. SpR8]
MGGINPAGRTSGHQAFRRTVLDALPADQQRQTLEGLAALMRLVEHSEKGWLDRAGQPVDAPAESLREQVLNHTLIRRNEDPRFLAPGMPSNRQASMQLAEPMRFTLRRRQLPDNLPTDWQVRDIDTREVEVVVPAGVLNVLLPDAQVPKVRAAAQLPSGFDPANLYRSVHHPRGLSLAVFGASDCLGASGLSWETLRQQLNPDHIAVYAGNSIGQLDDQGWGGLLKSLVSGQRATSKQMPLGYGQMPADFLNAYVLGSVGGTGAALGACASFLYNLRLGIDDIRAGRRRVVMVGTADAPITPEIIEGFRAMGALADDAGLKALDALELLTDSDYQRACRPFARNCGFTMAEASQFVLLMDDALALEVGADILGAVPEVFVNADGYKRSISAPGIGNYITLGKAAAFVRDMLGERALKERSFLHAHGTSTPKNRITESHVFDEIARANGINDWPIVAIKAFIGHSQGSAAGDQLASALGSFAHDLLPGIPTLDAVADDVYGDRLRFSQTAQPFRADAAFINAKGFGGNNATGVVLSPAVTERLLLQRHGAAAVSAWKQRREITRAAAAAYLAEADLGHYAPRYQFGEAVLEGPELDIHADRIHIPGYDHAVSLASDNPFGCLDEESSP